MRITDRYRAFVCVSPEDSRVFSISEDFGKYYGKYEELRPHQEPSNPDEAYLVSSSGHDCREYLLDGIASGIEKYTKNKYTQTPDAVFIYFSDGVNGGRLNNYHREAVLKFSRIFSTSRSRDFNLTIEDGYGVLSYDAWEQAYNHHLYAAAASFLLYILTKKTTILDWANNYIDENPKTTLKTMMVSLSTAFLENKDWGNSANENVSMSVFAYNFGTGAAPNNLMYDSDGPEEYAECNIQVITLQNWVRKIALPHIERSGLQIKNSTGLVNNVLPVHSGLRENFKIALRSLLVSEGM